MDSGSEAGTGTDTFKRSLSARDSRPSSSAGTNKVFPKLGKLSGTIEEAGDVETFKEPQSPAPTLTVDSKQLSLRRLESYDGGLITAQPGQDREILAAVLEVKVDLKLEVQRVNQRLAKLEDMLQILINRLPVPTAVAPTSVSTSGSPTAGGGTSSPPQQRTIEARNQQANSSNQTTVATSPGAQLQNDAVTQTPGTLPEQKVTTTATSPLESSREALMMVAASSWEGVRVKDPSHHHHHHHHHHQQQQQQQQQSQSQLSEYTQVSDRLTGSQSTDYKSVSSREVSKELLERLAQASTSRDDTTALGPLILRKRRSKSRNKGVAPLAPLATQPVSPTDPTETTQMLEAEESSSVERTERTDRSERKRPPPRPREYL